MRWLLLVLVTGGAPRAYADEVDALRREIRNSNEGKAIEAATKLAEDVTPGACEAILDELAIGAPPKVSAALLAGLSGRKEPRATEVLVLYARNRNPELRKKAVVAIAELTDPRVVPTLIGALSDSVEEVRAAAARALAKRKETSAEEPLVKLLAHRDAAAVDAIAAIGGPSSARRLGELVGQIPDSLLAATLGELLKRPDFGPDPIRLEVVKAISKLAGAEATAALTEYVQATEKEKTRPSRVEAKKAIEQRGTN
ncbi:MAG: HEAT repeat domain-containing protein [Myxococcales bacterium]|nr:HEAT repeat domain-containing protein [Myxococcales bacterium]